MKKVITMQKRLQGTHSCANKLNFLLVAFLLVLSISGHGQAQIIYLPPSVELPPQSGCPPISGMLVRETNAVSSYIVCKDDVAPYFCPIYDSYVLRLCAGDAVTAQIYNNGVELNPYPTFTWELKKWDGSNYLSIQQQVLAGSWSLPAGTFNAPSAGAGSYLITATIGSTQYSFHLYVYSAAALSANVTYTSCNSINVAQTLGNYPFFVWDCPTPFAPVYATVDWGDGSPTENMYGMFLPAEPDLQHTYATSGIYTLTITDSQNPCGVRTYTKTIYIGQSVTIDMGIPSYVNCQLDSVVLSAVANSNNVIYQWSKNGVPISGATYAAYTVTSGGTYGVKVTNNASGCTATASQVVNETTPMASITQTSTSTANCGIQYTLSANPNGATSYAWSAPSGFSGTLNTKIISNANVPGTYTVTVTTSGCTSTASVYVSPNIIIGSGSSYAQSNLSYYINNNLLLPTSGTINATNTAQKIRVKGTLNVDMNYTFASGSVITALNAPGGTVININASRTLNLVGTTAQGCDTMWRGFALAQSSVGAINTGGRIELSNNSFVRDAYYGVLGRLGSRIGVSNTTFDNNFIGIAGNGGLANGMFSSLGSFYQNGSAYFNTFKSSGNKLKAPYTNIGSGEWGLPAPTIGQYGYAGIYLNGIGSTWTVQGVWDNLLNGIVVYNNNLIVQNPSAFTDMYYQSGYGSSSTGNGIYAKGSTGLDTIPAYSLVVNGHKPSEAYVFFMNVNAAVQADCVNTDVHGSAISNSLAGIIAQNNRRGYTSIRQNNIQSLLYGVGLQNNDPYYQQWVDSNIVTMTVSFGVGAIYDNETTQQPYSSNSASGITNNTVYVQPRSGSYAKGIQVVAAWKQNVEGNKVYIYDNGKTQAGVEMQGCGEYLVKNNAISGAGYNSGNNIYYPAGVSINGSNNNGVNQICGNITNNTYSGLLMSGQNTGITWFVNNTFQNHYNGLWVKDGAIVPQIAFFGSIPSRNIFIGPNYTNKAAIHYDISAALNQKIYFPDGTPAGTSPGYLPVSGKLQPSSGWFSSTSNTLSSCCGVTCKNDGSEEGELSALSAFQHSVASKTLHYPLYNVEQQWQAEDNLYNSMRGNSALRSVSSLSQNFFSEKDISSSGKLARLRDKATEFEQNNPYVATIGDLQESKQALLYALISADSALANANTEIERERAQTQVNTLREQIEESSRQIGQLGSGLAGYLKEKAVELLGNNAQITAKNRVPQNEQLFNDVWLHTKFQNRMQFTPQQVQTLEYLAFQCPLQGGQAVYKARSLYSAVKDTIFDDGQLCAVAEKSYKTASTNKQPADRAMSMFIYPNPAANTVYVTVTGVVSEDIQVEWMDALGRMVRNDKLSATESTAKTYMLETNSLQNGVYQFVAKQGAATIYTQKVVITK